jgi:hypothetical protein
MVGSKLEPLINVCCKVRVNFRSQLHEYSARQLGNLEQEFFKNKKCTLNGILPFTLLFFSCIHHNSSESNYMKVTIREIPIQAWTGPEGSRKLRLPDFMHMQVARLSALRTGRFYSPGNIIGTHFF